MPRKPRLECPGGTFHVTARGVDKEFVFRDVFDRRLFFGRLMKVIERYGWRCSAYCLMGTHYHLLLTTPAANLAEGMQRLNGGFAQEFNRRHRRRGHLFGGRYAATAVVSDEHLLAVARYVVVNPVAAGLCDDPAAWEWSSYRATAGLDGAPPFLDVRRLLARFSRDRARAETAYRRFVDLPVAPARSGRPELPAGRRTERGVPSGHSSRGEGADTLPS